MEKHSIFVPILVLLVLPYTTTASEVASRNESIHRLLSITIEAPNFNFGLYNVQYEEGVDDRSSMAQSSTMFFDEINSERRVDRKNIWYKYREYIQMSCPQTGPNSFFKMTEEQKRYSGYSVWQKGHLTPANPNLYNEDAMKGTHVCLNAVPQEPYSNCHIWRDRELEVERFMKTKMAGVIITGKSKAFIPGNYGATEAGYRAPEYIWKLFCYKNGETAVVIGLNVSNSLIPSQNLNERDELRRIRNDNSKIPRNQTDIRALAEDGVIDNAWNSATDLKRNRPGKDSVPSPAECMQAATIPTSVVTEWNDFITRLDSYNSVQDDECECDEC